MEDTKLQYVKDRAMRLHECLCLDPDRPFWQVELTEILLAHSDLMSLLCSDLVSSCGDVAALKERVTSLEHRYSELLYRMSERT